MTSLQGHVKWLAAAVVLCTLASPARAQLQVSQPVVDLGQIRTGQVVEHRFVLTNGGSNPAEIIDAKASCGCLQPVVDRQVIPPGEKASLLLKVQTLSAPAGSHSWRVELRYRVDRITFEMLLMIRAEVVQEIVVQPPAMMVHTEGAVQHELVVTDLRARSFRIARVEATSPHLKAAVVHEQPDAAGHMVRRIRLQVTDTLPGGRHDEHLAVYTDDPTYRELRIPISIVKRDKQRYSAVPSSVSVVASKSQPVVTRLLTIRDNQGQPVTIQRVVADDPAITCQWSPGTNAVATVKISVDASRIQGGSLNSRVQVFLDQTSKEGFVIPVTCDVR